MSAPAVLPEKHQPAAETSPRPEDEADTSPYLWTCDEYLRLAEAGFFGDKRVELLDGEILRIPAQYTPHATAARKTAIVLRALCGARYIVEAQFPTLLNNWSLPEPDVTVIPGSPDDYRKQHPGVADIKVLVEVSDSTLRTDRGKKARAYARAGIADYWIVNLVNRRLEVHRAPMPDGRYQDIQNYGPEDAVSPLALPDAEIRVADLLPALEE